MKQRTEQQPDASTRLTQLPFFNRQTNAQAVVQTKLTVGSSNDAHEQEANKTADMVMRKPENSAQNGAYTEGSYFLPTITPMVQRACAHCDNEKEQTAQRKETGAATSGFAAPPSVANAISRSGSALDGNAKTFMESRFNRSFDNVQVHTDGESAVSAHDISARAYTSGNHIVFGEGQYQPNSDSGRHLLAHELTHVVQQNGSVQRDLAVAVSHPDAVAPEMTADQIQQAIAYNSRLLRDAWEIEQIRDILGGIPNLPAVIDEDFITALADYQAQNNIGIDGKLGAVTSSRLSREMIHEATGLTLAQSRELRQSARRMGTRALRMTVSSAAVATGTLGAASFSVRWHIADNQADGFVIQHVRFSGALTDSTGAVVTPNLPVGAGNADYWEVWRVRNGIIDCGSGTAFQSACDDTFGLINQPSGSQGTLTINGEVSFYPDYTLNAAWITANGHPSGILPHRGTRPPQWNGAEAMRHRMTVRYDDVAKTPTVVRTIP